MNQLRTMSTLSVVVCVLFAAAVHVDAASLSRDLSVGSVGEDVRNLQRFLNTDSSTRVAVVGVGSSGNETNFFGPATRAAVERFQAKFPDETYKKAGLQAPNGYVGALTRQAMNVRMGYSNTQATTKTYSGSGFVYEPNSSALAPVVVPKYGDPVTTSNDVAIEAYQRDAAAVLARGRLAAIDAIMRQSATTSVATSTVPVASASRQSLPASVAEQNVSVSTTSLDVISSSPTVTFVGPTAAEVGDRVNVFGTNIPSDLRIKIGSKTALIKGVAKDGLRAYFTVPRLAEGVYTLEFTSKRESDELEATVNQTLSIVGDIVDPRVTSVPDVLVAGQTVTLLGSGFNSNGETYLNGVFGLIKATKSSENEAVFKLPLLKSTFGNIGTPTEAGVESVLPYVVSTPNGQTMFTARTLLK